MTRLTVDQAVAQAHQSRQAGRPADAEAICRQVLGVQPDHAAALHLLGILALEAGKLPAAAEFIRRAIVQEPNSFEAYNNLGVVLRRMGDAGQAVAAHRQAVRLNPNSADGQYNLGLALKRNGQPRDAAAAFREAIRLSPAFADAHNQLGNACREVGQLDDAIAAYRQAIRLAPVHGDAYNNLGSVLKEVGRLDDAMIGAELRRWNERHGVPLRQFIQPHRNSRDRDRRLRIGYVSADFSHHVVGQNILPILREHDRSQVEVFCYSNVIRADEFTEEFRRHASGWRDIVGMPDAAVAKLIRKDGIDILVDLALHTGGNRLTVFAQKPAPVQVTFAGYPGSTGLETIDYRLTDPYLDPPGSDPHGPETPIRLPDSFWCYDPRDSDVAVNPLPALTNAFITFGCLNTFCKVNEQVLKLWARVLRKVSGSRLIMLCPQGNHRRGILETLGREGVEPERVELAERRPRRNYLELFHRIDAGLDTLPYNGHTTSLDSFWMGVPVITLVGRTIVGRAGLSQLSNLGLTELVARDEEEFVRIAAELAGDLPRLSELRRTLRTRMRAGPLMDALRFARNVENAYRTMWRAFAGAIEQGTTSPCPR